MAWMAVAGICDGFPDRQFGLAAAVHLRLGATRHASYFVKRGGFLESWAMPDLTPIRSETLLVDVDRASVVATCST